MINASSKPLILALAGILGFGLAAQGQIVLAQWDFSSDLDATTTAADVSASAFSTVGGNFDNSGQSSGPGVNLDGSSYVNGEPIHNTKSWTGDGGRYFARPFDDSSISSGGKHVAFDITLDQGSQYYLENLWFDFGIRFDAGDQISVQMSDNSDFTNPIVLGAGEATGLEADSLGYQDDNGTTSLGINQPDNIQNFSWTRLENTLDTPVTLSGSTYFRIYIAGGEAENEFEESSYLDNVTIEGTVVPEPSAYAALFGLMAFGFVACRRRR
ncbi:MAG: PEP-CTERM sorting domain-containing protein [Opitutales bacterium]